MTNETTAAEQYRQQLELSNQAEIVDVKVPSGFIFKFRKPSKLGMLFGMGSLPQVASSLAISKWTEEGVVKALENGDPDVIKIAETMFTLRDKVLSLSVSPKLVAGTAKDGEISTDDVSDNDLTYLLHWVMAGGEVSEMLNTFPVRQQPSAVAQSNRKERRTKAKQAGGAR